MVAASASNYSYTDLFMYHAVRLYMLADSCRQLAVSSQPYPNTAYRLLPTCYKKGYWGASNFCAPLPPLRTTHFALRTPPKEERISNFDYHKKSTLRLPRRGRKTDPRPFYSLFPIHRRGLVLDRPFGERKDHVAPLPFWAPGTHRGADSNR